MEPVNRLTQMQLLKLLTSSANKDDQSCLTLDELELRLAVPRKMIVKRMQALIKNRYACGLRIGCYTATPEGHKRYIQGGTIKSGPKPDTNIQARRVDRTSLRARLWRSLRMVRRATISDLLQICVNSNDGSSARDSAHRLLSQLARCNYVHKLPKRAKPTRYCSNGEVIYYLVKDTGPNPPAEILDKDTGLRGLMDRNTGEFTPYQDAQPRPRAAGAA